MRREFGHPDLPFVIAALGQSGEAMNANARKVHDAQMAVASTVSKTAGIDTIPDLRP